MFVRRTLPGFVGLAVAACACGAPDEAAEQDAAAGQCDESAEGAEDHDPEAEAFPHRLSIDHAENFDITYEGDHQVLTVSEPSPGAEPEEYVLLRCGAPAPDLEGGLADAPVIEVPVRSVFSGSTTHLPLFAELGRLDAVTGVADAAFVNDEEVREAAEAGEVAEYAAGGAIDTETVIAESPDLIMSGGTEEPEYETLRDADIPVVANAEWLEADPLGRAEWIKLAAALTGTEEQAEEVFDGIVADYTETAEQVSDAEPVEVLPGHMFDGVWSVPGGGSYMGRLLADAGATYTWHDAEEVGSLELDLEEVLDGAGEAPVWIAGDDWHSLDDVTAAEPRYEELAAFRDGEVWTVTGAVGPGGLRYWDEGVLRPDVVLADLAHILHPELMDDHEPVYYQRLD
jgi:iron complex transport system substrate-binding protein